MGQAFLHKKRGKMRKRQLLDIFSVFVYNNYVFGHKNKK